MPWASRSRSPRRSALKGHQPQLHEAVVEAFAVEQTEGFKGCDHDFHKTVNKNHGRIETRRCWIIGTLEYIQYVDPDGAWPDLHCLVMIEAQRRQGSQVTSRTRCYIPSLSPDARILLQAVRKLLTVLNAVSRDQVPWQNHCQRWCRH